MLVYSTDVEESSWIVGSSNGFSLWIVNDSKLFVGTVLNINFLITGLSKSGSTSFLVNQLTGKPIIKQIKHPTNT